MAHHGGVGVEADPEKLHVPVAEAENVGGPGPPDELRDLHGCALLRVDDEIDSEVFRLQHRVGALQLVGARAGHGRLHAQPISHHAGNQVDLVNGRDGHEQVRPSDSGLFQHLGRGAVAVHRHHVEGVLDVVQDVFFDVDHGDVVLLQGEDARYVEPDLAGADDYSLHETRGEVIQRGNRRKGSGFSRRRQPPWVLCGPRTRSGRRARRSIRRTRKGERRRLRGMFWGEPTTD